MSKINKASQSVYKTGTMLRWVKAIQSCIKQGSIAPLIRRLVNVWIGRNVVSKLWLKPKKRK